MKSASGQQRQRVKGFFSFEHNDRENKSVAAQQHPMDNMDEFVVDERPATSALCNNDDDDDDGIVSFDLHERDNGSTVDITQHMWNIMYDHYR